MVAGESGEGNIHLVDHYLAIWMMRTMQDMKRIAAEKLGVTWDANAFKRVLVIQGEERGLNGRGAFFDGVGQGRDMVQSHLLQVMASALAPLDDSSHATSDVAKLAILKACSVSNCAHGQYNGFL